MIGAKCASWAPHEAAAAAADVASRLLRSIWATVLDGFAVYGACMEGCVSAAVLQFHTAVRPDEHADTHSQTVGAGPYLKAFELTGEQK